MFSVNFYGERVYRSTDKSTYKRAKLQPSILTSILSLKIIYFKFTIKAKKFPFDGKSVELIFTSRYILPNKVTEQCLVISQTKIKYDAKQRKDYDHRGN